MYQESLTNASTFIRLAGKIKQVKIFHPSIAE